jgi:putative heme iron utilization protein
MSTIDLETVRAEYEVFPERFDSLLMATVSSEGEPNASYAAYVRQGSDFYVYISELAAHTRNLKEQGKVSVFFIENEADSKNLFARKRITYQCTAHHMPRDEAGFAPMMEKFSQKFGDTMDTLRDMKDFHLYRLHPLKATYVSGFARAFVVEGEELDKVRHLNDVGHRAASREAGERVGPLHNGNAAA